MKRILITCLSILILILLIIILVKGIKIGPLKIESIKEIKSKNAEIHEKSIEAKTLVEQNYNTERDNLQEAIKNLKEQKEKYENKTATITDAEVLGATQTKTYKVEYLWTTIGNYATKEGTTLTLDVAQTNSENVYDLKFTLVGSYIPITTFIYDIENDENLKFQIKDFKMQVATENSGKSSDSSSAQSVTDNTNNVASDNTSGNTNTTNTKKNNTTTNKQQQDGSTLQATFTVENVSIELN